eukprot:750373-Rhodomonas_salina.2
MWGTERGSGGTERGSGGTERGHGGTERGYGAGRFEGAIILDECHRAKKMGKVPSYAHPTRCPVLRYRAVRCSVLT